MDIKNNHKCKKKEGVNTLFLFQVAVVYFLSHHNLVLFLSLPPNSDDEIAALTASLLVVNSLDV